MRYESEKRAQWNSRQTHLDQIPLQDKFDFKWTKEARWGVLTFTGKRAMATKLTYLQKMMQHRVSVPLSHATGRQFGLFDVWLCLVWIGLIWFETRRASGMLLNLKFAHSRNKNWVISLKKNAHGTDRQDKLYCLSQKLTDIHLLTEPNNIFTQCHEGTKKIKQSKKKGEKQTTRNIKTQAGAITPYWSVYSFTEWCHPVRYDKM